MSEYIIDVDIGTRAVRNIITERTVPALQTEQKWLKAAWKKFDNLPDDHQLNVSAMRVLLEKTENYIGSLSSAFRAGLDTEEAGFQIEMLDF